MKLMSSSLLRCPCTEFNLHSPKSHAVIWHVYQTEATQHRPASAPPSCPCFACTRSSHCPFVLVIRALFPHTDTHSRCLSLLLYLWFSPCTNDAYLAAAQAINPSSGLSLSHSSLLLFLSLSLPLFIEPFAVSYASQWQRPHSLVINHSAHHKRDFFRSRLSLPSRRATEPDLCTVVHTAKGVFEVCGSTNCLTNATTNGTIKLPLMKLAN